MQLLFVRNHKNTISHSLSTGRDISCFLTRMRLGFAAISLLILSILLFTEGRAEAQIDDGIDVPQGGYGIISGFTPGDAPDDNLTWDIVDPFSFGGAFSFASNRDGHGWKVIFLADTQTFWIYAPFDAQRGGLIPFLPPFYEVRYKTSPGVYYSASFKVVAADKIYRFNRLRLNPVTVVGGDAAEGDLRLETAAPRGGMTIPLTSNNANVIVPKDVFFAEGETEVLFPIQTISVLTIMNARITAYISRPSANPRNDPVSSNIIVVPLLIFDIAPSLVVGGANSTGTIKLGHPAPVGGAVITVSSSDPSLASAPATVTVAEGMTIATFPIVTTPVSTMKTAYITGSYGIATIKRKLDLVSPYSLTSLTLNPTKVQGGTASTGTVSILTAAPAGGILVTLGSNNSSLASVPVYVKIPAGQNTATFNVTTRRISYTYTVSISAKFGGTTKAANLQLTY